MSATAIDWQMRFRRWWTTSAFLGVSLLVLECAHQTSGQSASAGFLIVGPSSERDFHLLTGDTLPETSAVAVPRRVTIALKQQANALGFSAKCTRIFSAHRQYVAVFNMSCDSSGPAEDGQGMAVFDSTGAPLTRPVPWLSGHYLEIAPRTRSSR